MKETISGGGVILNSKKEVVVVSQNGNSWSLPKGHVDPGENELMAANREIYKETGLKPESLKLIREFKPYQRHTIAKGGQGENKEEMKTLHMFLFKTNQEKLEPIDPKNPEALWVEINKVADLLTHPKDKEFFKSIKSEL